MARKLYLMTKSMHLKADLAKIDELIAAISQKKERFMSYRSNQYLCPYCFIHKKTSVEMRPIPSNSSIDIIKYSHCSSELEKRQVKADHVGRQTLFPPCRKPQVLFFSSFDLTAASMSRPRPPAQSKTCPDG